MLRKISNPTVLVLVLVTGTLLTSCGSGNQPTTTEESTPTSSSPAPSPKTGFEADLEYVRKGQYTYVWVFSRKDGKSLDKDDGDFLRRSAPQVVDWVTSDPSKKKIVAGTNFDLAQGNLELIKKRFVAEDYSVK